MKELQIKEICQEIIDEQTKCNYSVEYILKNKDDIVRAVAVNKHTKKPHHISGKAFLWKNPAAAYPKKAQQHKIMPPTPAETSQHRSGGKTVRSE